MSTSTRTIARRPYREGVELSVLGFGGYMLVGLEQEEANHLVARAVDRGVNYFDVAPGYGNGEAEEKLGVALRPYRDRVFLACKTYRRSAEGASDELERSLQRLQTDHLDLYQFHGVRRKDVDRIFASGGAAEVFLRAREEGQVRFIGFSSHDDATALAMLDSFAFDSVLFPVNFVCYAQAGVGPRVIQSAKQKGASRLAIKALAFTPWGEGEARDYPNCWYRPVSDPELAWQALRFTLSEDVTAAVSPGDHRLLPLVLELAAGFSPLEAQERERLLASTRGVQPIFPRADM